MKTYALVIAALIATLFISGAYAAGMWGAGSSQRGLFHEQMEEIMEAGTYEDLVALREETGLPMMRRVQDSESFAQMQEHHKQMEAQYGEGPHYAMMGRGMMGGRGGCR